MTIDKFEKAGYLEGYVTQEDIYYEVIANIKDFANT